MWTLPLIQTVPISCLYISKSGQSSSLKSKTKNPKQTKQQQQQSNYWPILDTRLLVCSGAWWFQCAIWLSFFFFQHVPRRSGKASTSAIGRCKLFLKHFPPLALVDNLLCISSILKCWSWDPEIIRSKFFQCLRFQIRKKTCWPNVRLTETKRNKCVCGYTG